MTEWITLQEAADLIGVRKGTLCMWRLRDRFPFRSKGKGRGLVVSKNSVQGWLDKGGKAGVRRGRPGGKGIRAVKKAAAPRRKSAAKLSLRTDAGLEEIQGFVAALKGGRSIRVTPDKKGYVLTLGE